MYILWISTEASGNLLSSGDFVEVWCIHIVVGVICRVVGIKFWITASVRFAISVILEMLFVIEVVGIKVSWLILWSAWVLAHDLTTILETDALRSLGSCK